METSQKRPGQPLNVRAEPEELRGRYANTLVVTAQDREVIIDFISRVTREGSNDGTLVARIFLHHYTADDLYRLLTEIRKRWEDARSGGIKEDIPKNIEPTKEK
ncbi:MAG: DUF3467 domain-containing protein [Patescibacteria group bacterium]